MATGTRGVVVEQPPLEGVPVNNSIFGVGKGGFYDPVDTVGFGSSQVVRLTSLDWLGPWRPASQCFCEASQDWLFRSWRKGAVIATMPHLTVLKLHSGNRRDYVEDLATKGLVAAMETPNTLRVRVLAVLTDRLARQEPPISGADCSPLAAFTPGRGPSVIDTNAAHSSRCCARFAASRQCPSASRVCRNCRRSTAAARTRTLAAVEIPSKLTHQMKSPRGSLPAGFSDHRPGG